MDLRQFRRRSETEWIVEPADGMRVPAIVFATEDLVRGMDQKVYEQVTNVARLPGIVKASFAMPDAHWGYGFPIGGVAAFDADEGGVISAGGVGYDVSCGVRALLTGLTVDEVRPVRDRLADLLFRTVPVGVGSRGKIKLDEGEMDAMLAGGASWAIGCGFGEPRDLERIEEKGRMPDAIPGYVSDRARERQREEMGTLGSGNHYLEVQYVAEVFDGPAAEAFGIGLNDVIVSIHCGSRGLGHQVGTEFLKEMAIAAGASGLRLPDRELACAPIKSPVGRRYIGAMRSAINCALANRQIITHLTRDAFPKLFPGTELTVLYDVSHNTCKVEHHRVDGEKRRLYVHRKGATRAFGPGHPELPEVFKKTGQPVLIGGTMGTASYILAGTEESEKLAFSSACHGAGRAMSRHQALRQWQGRQLLEHLSAKGITVRSPSMRGVAEEAPGAYKDVDAVVEATDRAGLARRVAKLVPIVCIKG